MAVGCYHDHPERAAPPRLQRPRSRRRQGSRHPHIAAGTYELGPHIGRLLVKTSRTGLGPRAGHDLTIEVTRWRGRALVDPADPASSMLAVDVDVDSFEVRDGTGGVKPLTDSDRTDIKQTIREKILRTVRHPTITFRSRTVRGTAPSFAVEGVLTIMGATRPVTIQGGVTEGRLRGTATLVQSQWGIRPYSALLGALKLKDEVVVEFDVALHPPGSELAANA
jgi:polyisoprenoid-binding protein YceI